LKTLDDTTITIRFDGSNPLLIDTDGENYTYVVMPMSGEKDAPSPNQAWDEAGIDLTALRKQENEEQLAQMRQDVEAKVAAQLADADDESEYEPETESEVPIDSDGDVATDYYHNVIPDTFVNPVKGTVVDFGAIVGMPSFCPDAHLFRAEIDHHGMTWYVEWDCIPGKRIIPDWERPDRIVLPECPVDANGYMTWEYLESLDEGVRLSLMELPRFLPEESLFRTTCKSADEESVVVEWACLPGKRRLVATRPEGIGAIDDWASPSRIIPLDEFTNEIIGRSGLLAEAEDAPSEWATDDVDKPETESAIEATEAERERVRTQTKQIVPVNNEGYVSEAYFAHHVSVIIVDDPENETYTEYEPNVPRYYHAESLYRAEARIAEFDDDGERLRVNLEWDSFDGKMSLVHWQNPDRIIPLTEYVPEPTLEPTVETESPDDNPVRPQVQPYVAETVSRPANKPMTMPKPKQRAMQWT